jgi:hypothetical protein
MCKDRRISRTYKIPVSYNLKVHQCTAKAMKFVALSSFVSRKNWEVGIRFLILKLNMFSASLPSSLLCSTYRILSCYSYIYTAIFKIINDSWKEQKEKIQIHLHSFEWNYYIIKNLINICNWKKSYLIFHYVSDQTTKLKFWLLLDTLSIMFPLDGGMWSVF